MSALAVAALGPAPPQVLDSVETALRQAFALDTLRANPVAEPEIAYSAARGQWSSLALLKALLVRVPPGAVRLLGVTERDLFVPVLTFVYGQAQLEGTVAVVSLARLRPEFHGLAPDSPTLERRAAVEAVHELGHTFGLVHCLDRRCPMSLSIDLTDLDHKTAEPCPACSAMLEGSLEMKRARAVQPGGRR
jgi:archaemetzincin